MLWTQHPLHSEFFDLESFVEENTSSLRELFDRAVENHPQDDLDEDEWDVTIALLMSHAIYSETDDPTVEAMDASGGENEEAILDMAQMLTILVVMFHLEDTGHVSRTSMGWKRQEQNDS